LTTCSILLFLVVFILIFGGNLARPEVFCAIDFQCIIVLWDSYPLFFMLDIIYLFLSIYNSKTNWVIRIRLQRGRSAFSTNNLDRRERRVIDGNMVRVISSCGSLCHIMSTKICISVDFSSFSKRRFSIIKLWYMRLEKNYPV